MKTKRKKELENMTEIERLIHHVPNQFHLENCKQGSTIQRNRKKYTRKGKNRFDARKALSSY